MKLIGNLSKEAHARLDNEIDKNNNILVNSLHIKEKYDNKCLYETINILHKNTSFETFEYNIVNIFAHNFTSNYLNFIHYHYSSRNVTLYSSILSN